MDYIHRPVSSIEHDVSETGSLSVLIGLARSTGPNWIGFTSLHPPEDGDRTSLRNVVFYWKNRTMDIAHKQVSLVYQGALTIHFSTLFW
jgi:hypothetical protein